MHISRHVLSLSHKCIGALLTVMKKIEIIINEFGPLSNQTITLAPFMIFTGKSGLGKSYANYLTYYFFSSFTEGRLKGLVENKIKKDRTDQQFTITEDELRQWLNNEVEEFMRDFLGDGSLICNVNFIFSLGDDKILNISYTKEDLKKELQETLESQRIIMADVTINSSSKSHIYEFTPDETSSSITRVLGQYLQKNLFEQYFVKSIILPPARGAYVGENYTTKDRIASSTGMYRLFLRDSDQSQIPFPVEKADRQFFTSQIERLIDGKLVSEKGLQSLELPNGHKIPLTASASSIKELSPLLFYTMNWPNMPLSICLEEPEAHLHPDMQVDIANLLAALFNKQYFLQLTTHSDYFLQRINQLIKIGYIRQEQPEAYKQLCKDQKLNNRFYLDANQIKAYYFHADENHQSHVEELKIGRNGIPFSTFFDTVKRLREEEDNLNDILDSYGGTSD